MIDWIKSLFKKEEKLNTAIHPETKKLVEKVQAIKGRMLYKFVDLLDMPHKRYNSCTRFSTEFNMRLDANILRESLTAMGEAVNKGDITNIEGIRRILLAHLDMLISLDASYRLASCVYFWKDENLDDYDYEIGDEKIKLFKEIGFDSFFLSKPMNNFLPQMDLSNVDSRIYLQHEKELKKLLSDQLNSRKEKNTKTT